MNDLYRISHMQRISNDPINFDINIREPPKKGKRGKDAHTELKSLTYLFIVVRKSMSKELSKPPVSIDHRMIKSVRRLVENPRPLNLIKQKKSVMLSSK